jgi:hypothetical protein
MDIFPKIPPTATFSQIEITQAADPKGLHIVLEGRDDIDFLKGLFLNNCKHTVPVQVHWVNACGRPYCMKVHQLCLERGTGRVLFVVDADFDRKLNVLQTFDALAYTDRNDMECTVLAVDPVLERVQDEYEDKESVSHLLDMAGHSSLFSLAVDRASHIGKHRFVDKRDKLSLRFKNPKPDTDPPYESFLRADKSLSWDEDAFRDWLSQRNPEAAAKVARLFEEVEQLQQADEEKLDWCQGHDLIALHAVIHNRIVAAAGGNKTDGRRLEDFVRRNVEPSRVRAAQVIQRIEVFVGWELLSRSGVGAEA